MMTKMLIIIGQGECDRMRVSSPVKVSVMIAIMTMMITKIKIMMMMMTIGEDDNYHGTEQASLRGAECSLIFVMMITPMMITDQDNDDDDNYVL